MGQPLLARHASLRLIATAAPRHAAAAVLFSSPAYEADGRALADAEQRLVRRCMARRGFVYRAAPAPPAPP